MDESLPRAGDVLVFGKPPHAGSVIAADDLAPEGPPVFAWAMEPSSGFVRQQSRLGQVLVVRLRVGAIGEVGSRVAANGVVAFSAICTHAGCAVSGWQPAARLLRCPCHGSAYDPAAGGRVVAGPAPRPLPALPLRLDRDVVTVAGGFSARLGGYTGRTD